MSGLSRPLPRTRTLVLAIIVFALAAMVSASGAVAKSGHGHGNSHGHGNKHKSCEKRDNNTYKKILECVRLSEVREHQWALQRIADRNDGNRFSGFAGFNKSVDYVVKTLKHAGYKPQVMAFDYLAYEEIGPSALQQSRPARSRTSRAPTSGRSPRPTPVTSPRT